MSCFLIGENNHAHEIGEQLQQSMIKEEIKNKESFQINKKTKMK